MGQAAALGSRISRGYFSARRAVAFAITAEKRGTGLAIAKKQRKVCHLTAVHVHVSFMSFL